MKTKNLTLRCADNAEALVFTQFNYEDTTYPNDYEVNIEDSYCGGDYMGINGRFKRAWHAFWAKPIYYSGICISNKEDLKKWLEDCLAIINEE